MAAVAEVGNTLLSKCLDFCQALSSQGQAFNFSVAIGQDFTFSLDTRSKETSPVTLMRKKASPSALRRNARRKEEFLQRKQNSSTVKPSEVKTVVNALSCDQCDFKPASEKGLMQHKRMKHGPPQLPSTQATPERPRQKPRSSGSLSASPLLDTNREDESEEKEELNSDETSPPPVWDSTPPLPTPLRCELWSFGVGMCGKTFTSDYEFTCHIHDEHPHVL